MRNRLLWTLLNSLVMLKGIFSKATGYLGVAGSTVGHVHGVSVFVPTLATLLMILMPLLAIWLPLEGPMLYRSGKRQSRNRGTDFREPT